jgi:hypothetical protein
MREELIIQYMLQFICFVKETTTLLPFVNTAYQFYDFVLVKEGTKEI